MLYKKIKLLLKFNETYIIYLVRNILYYVFYMLVVTTVTSPIAKLTRCIQNSQRNLGIL